jgi:hypothetical protein
MLKKINMKQEESMKQYPAFEKGLRLCPAPGSDTDMTAVEITETGLKDTDGFNAVRIEYKDAFGQCLGEDVVAIAVLQEGIDAGMEVIA